MAELPPVPTVQGITQADYQAWRHHPCSKMFLQYLRDWRHSVLRSLLAQWEADQVTLALDTEVKGRVKTLGELSVLPFEAIYEFYQEQSEESDEGRPTAEDGNS